MEENERLDKAELAAKKHGWVKWGAMAACLCLILAVAILSGCSKPNGGALSSSNLPQAEPPGSSSQDCYPYNDETVLDYVGFELDDVALDNGKIVFNEILNDNIDAYRIFNTAYGYQNIPYYSTRHAALDIIAAQPVANEEDVFSYCLFKENGTFSTCPGYQQHLDLSKENGELARFAESFFDLRGVDSVDCYYDRVSGLAGFQMMPTANTIFSIVAGEALDGVDERLDAILPVLRGGEPSELNGQKAAVHYFYQTRLFREKTMEEAFQYYLYLELNGAQYLCQYSSNWALPGKTVSALHNPPTTLHFVASQEECRKEFIRLAASVVDILAEK